MTENTNTNADAQAAALAAQGASPADVGSAVDNTGSKTPDVTNINKKPEPTAENEEHGKLSPEKQAEEDRRVAEAKAREEAAKAEKDDKTPKNDDPDVGVSKYVELQDEAGKAVIDLLKEANVSPIEANAIFNKAVETGDLNDIDWKALATKVSAAQLTLIKAGVHQHYENAYKVQKATVEAVHGIFEGEDNWNAVRDWAHVKEAKDPAFKERLDGIRQGIAQHGVVAELSARELRKLYEADPANKGLGTGKVLNGDTKSANTAGEPMTRAEYYKEVQALEKRPHTAAEKAALWARREAGIKAGK